MGEVHISVHVSSYDVYERSFILHKFLAYFYVVNCIFFFFLHCTIEYVLMDTLRIRERIGCIFVLSKRNFDDFGVVLDRDDMAEAEGADVEEAPELYFGGLCGILCVEVDLFLCFDDGEVFGLGHVGGGDEAEEEKKIKELVIDHYVILK